MADFQKTIFQSKAQISKAAADLFVNKSKSSIQEKGQFVVSLSGGSTPKVLFELLATEPYSSQIEWAKVHLFWGDERCVSPDHADSNYRMTRLALLDHIPIPATNVNRIKGELSPENAAADYNVVLKEFFGDESYVFDLCFLGMGDDGHTASIFPETSAVQLKGQKAKEVYVEKLSAWRITLSADILNSSKWIVFLVAGSGKAEALKEVFVGEFNPSLYPSQLIRSAENQVEWYLDNQAAALL